MRTFAALFTSFLFCQCASAIDAPDPCCPRALNVSAGNACRLDDVVVPCNSLGSRLKERHVSSSCDVHITVDRFSKYEDVSSALQSLRDAGYIKVGFVNVSDS